MATRKVNMPAAGNVKMTANHKQPERIENLVKYLVKRKKESLKEHMQWKDEWDDIIRNVIPKHRDADKFNSKGEKVGEDLYDNTSKRANNKVRDNLQSLLTPPTGKWFEMTTGNKKLDQNENVRNYLTEVERLILLHVNNSNFHPESLSVYEDVPSLGTGVIYLKKADEYQKKTKGSLLHFESERITRVALIIHNREVLGVIRMYKKKAREILAEYKDNLPDDFVRNAEKTGEREYDIDQVIIHKSLMPKEMAKGSKPWRNYKILCSQNWLMTKETEGWYHKPFSAPRWHVESDEDYGRGPGSDNLPDQKTLNSMKKVVLQGGQLAIAPPLQVADNSIFRKIKYKPFGVNFRKPGKDNRIETLTGGIQPRPDIGEALIAGIAETIEEGYYKKILEIVESDRMTATEIVTRRDENFRGFGSVLVRMSEMARDVIDNTYIILDRAGILPEAPTELKESPNISPRYLSLLAKAQIQAETETFTRAITNLEPLLTLKPEVADNLDGDFIFRQTFHELGVDSKFLLKEQQVDQNRRRAAERAAAQQEVENEKVQSETLKNVTQSAATGV